MQLDEFYTYKNKLMHDLLTTPEIVHLIDEDVSMEDAYKLAYTKVFPAEFVPETVDNGQTLVLFDVDVRKSTSKTYLEPCLYIWVIAHKSKLRLPEGGVRTDAICSEIAKKINGSMCYGLGEMDLYSVERFAPMSDYNGKVMTFRMLEFSKTYNPNKYIPSNRKTGI